MNSVSPATWSQSSWERRGPLPKQHKHHIRDTVETVTGRCTDDWLQSNLSLYDLSRAPSTPVQCSIPVRRRTAPNAWTLRRRRWQTGTPAASWGSAARGAAAPGQWTTVGLQTGLTSDTSTDTSWKATKMSSFVFTIFSQNGFPKLKVFLMNMGYLIHGMTVDSWILNFKLRGMPWQPTLSTSAGFSCQHVNQPTQPWGAGLQLGYEAERGGEQEAVPADRQGVEVPEPPERSGGRLASKQGNSHIKNSYFILINLWNLSYLLGTSNTRSHWSRLRFCFVFPYRIRSWNNI